jgi:homoserine kinase type II
MKDVYILHHTYGNSESETFKLLGVFESERQAEEAISNYVALPGFRDYPNGFEVSRHRLGMLGWVGGFGWEQADDVEE